MKLKKQIITTIVLLIYLFSITPLFAISANKTYYNDENGEIVEQKNYEKTGYRGSLLFLDFGARYLDSKYSRWLSTDPALQSYIPQGNSSQEDKAKEISQLPGMGGIYNTINSHLYHYAGNNPVKYVDPDGEAAFAAIFVWGFNIGLLSYGIGASRNDEYGFALRHPVIASEIGKVKTGVGCTNISTNSTRFSAAVGNDDFQEGGQVNAIRHALWSSTISSKYGVDIAKEATNSHESNSNLSGLIFSNKTEADSRCDLLNNEIGILLGRQNKKASISIIVANKIGINVNIK